MIFTSDIVSVYLLKDTKLLIRMLHDFVRLGVHTVLWGCRSGFVFLGMPDPSH